MSDTVAAQHLSSSRALVVITPEPVRAAERPAAGFVTQLIACNRRIGIYRNARRAEPAIAASLYRGPASANLAGFQRLI
jgi:hypothetical protein